MSGDRAQGLFCEVKSCSSVGSIYLRHKSGRRGAQVVSVRVQTTNARPAPHALHELECSARTPWQGKRAFEYVSKQYVVG